MRKDLDVSEWRPIETAPKERAVLVYCGGGLGAAKMSVARLHKDEWYITARYWAATKELVGGAVKLPDVPTHWQPLPEPPTEPSP